MAGLFKDRYDRGSLHKLALAVQEVYAGFPVEAFLDAAMDDTWDGLEFKQRVMRIGASLGRCLPGDYKTAIGIIDRVIENADARMDGFAFFFPAFVELYGQGEEDWAVSMAALERYTQYASAEFAVRAFIIKEEARMMAQMADWAGHDSEHVRRLASEGCRPRLPWGQALPSFQRDPSPILPILERLKADPSPYVRKSVANNLNDISKTHPGLVVGIAKAWYGSNKYTDQLLKHGCRTLLKQGDRDLLGLFGFAEAACVKVEGFSLGTRSVSIGEDMTFSFAVAVEGAAKVRLEYGIDYVKANGGRSRKIFQISQLTFKEKGRRAYTRRHSFADVSVRKHYPGAHSVTLIVNGAQRGTLDFQVVAGE